MPEYPYFSTQEKGDKNKKPKFYTKEELDEIVAKHEIKYFIAGFCIGILVECIAIIIKLK